MKHPSKRTPTYATAVLLGAALLAGCASGPRLPPTVALGDQNAVWRHLEQLIAEGMRQDGVAGLSIAVVDGQQLIWSKGFGWADAESQVPATAQTVYRMGSISKLFTSTAAIQLAQKGLLDIDAPVQRALPGFRVRAAEGQAAITPRLLMTHHAGLPRDVGGGMWGQQVGRFQDMVQALEPGAQTYPAGLMFSYSNVGMTVLGAALEQVASVPFETHLQRTLLEPLGMDTASFSQGTGPGVARAHKAGKVVAEPALRDTPAGALNASVLDMSRFMMMVLANGQAPGGQAILEPARLADMLKPQNQGHPLDFDLHTGLGWMLNSLGTDTLRNAGPVAHHAGATVHFHSQMYVLPAHRLGVIVAANSASAGKLVDTAAKRALGLVLEARTGIRQVPLAPEFVSSGEPLSDEQLTTWEGEYATVAGHARVWRDGRKLKVQAMEQELALLPATNGGMGLSYKLLGLVTVSVPDLQQFTLSRRRVQGRELLVARSGGQEMLVGERLAPPEPDPSALAWLGTYRPLTPPGEDEPVERIRLVLDKQRLLAQIQMSETGGGNTQVLPIRLVSDNEARVLQPLADFGETVHRREVNGQPAFEVSGITFVRSGP